MMFKSESLNWTVTVSSRDWDPIWILANSPSLGNEFRENLSWDTPTIKSLEKGWNTNRLSGSFRFQPEISQLTWIQALPFGKTELTTTPILWRELLVEVVNPKFWRLNRVKPQKHIMIKYEWISMLMFFHHVQSPYLSCWKSPKSILVGGIATPLKNMKVSWDDANPNIWKNDKCSKSPTSLKIWYHLSQGSIFTVSLSVSARTRHRRDRDRETDVVEAATQAARAQEKGAAEDFTAVPKELPSGDVKKSYWKWPFIVDCPMKHDQWLSMAHY